MAQAPAPTRNNMTLPNNLQEIVDDFASMSREEKLETLIAFAESMPDLPERFQEERSKMEPVPECMTPVFIIAEKGSNGGIVFHHQNHARSVCQWVSKYDRHLMPGRSPALPKKT